MHDAQKAPLAALLRQVGNTERVAAAHYLQVTDDHFRWATEAACSALQKAVQSGAAEPCMEPQAEHDAHEETPVLQGFASECEYLPTCQVPTAGLEPATSRM